MITLTDYAKHRDLLFPEEWENAKENAVILLEKVNAFLDELFPGHVFYVRSGFRPLSVNAITPGAAPHSYHIIGKAIDIADQGGFLRDNLRPEENEDQAECLRKYGLFLEYFPSTPFWCHLDYGDRADRPSRIFKP